MRNDPKQERLRALFGKLRSIRQDMGVLPWNDPVTRMYWQERMREKIREVEREIEREMNRE